MQNLLRSSSGRALVFIALAYITIIYSLGKWYDKDLLHWDESGYYLYLPATFIYHDPGHLTFYDSIQTQQHLNAGHRWYGIYDQPNGRKLIKYTMGCSLFELPFFGLAQVYCKYITKKHIPNGFSTPYMEAVILCTLTWTLIGLGILRRFLLRHFSDMATAATLLLLAFATNLYFYSVWEYGMSHQFSFVVFALLLYMTDLWHKTEKARYIIYIGLIMGLVILLRPTNFVVIIIPLLWNYKSAKQATAIYRRHAASVLIAVLSCIAILFLQCAYWKFITGHWIVFSYSGEGFDLARPHILKGLFSYQKGWFVYTPLALITLLAVPYLYRKNKMAAISIAIYMCVNVYLVFSWHQWYYGGTFGCRPMIESMVLLALPLTALCEHLFTRARKIVMVTFCTFFLFVIVLNVVQSYQVNKNILSWERTTRRQYWHVFMRLHN